MSVTISITESALLTALRSFLMGLVDGEVIQSQQNRVPMPKGSYCVMTPLFTSGLSTDKVAYAAGDANPGVGSHSRSTQWNVQLDFYGPGAEDNANIVATMIRTEYACQQFTAAGVDMQPLYATDPKQTTMINSEQQYESRWTMEFVAQFNPVVRAPQDFATSLNVELVNVDGTLPP